MAERVLREDGELALLPRCVGVGERGLREPVQRRARRPGQRRVVPERHGVVDELRGVVGLLRLAGVERKGGEHLLRGPPAAAEGCRVEPARVVPPGDVRRIEEHLPRHAAEPRPRRRLDRRAEPAQQSGRVDGRRLHEPRPVVERRVPEDRFEHGADVALAGDVRPRERVDGRRVGRGADEVRPQLRDEELRVGGMRHGEPHRVMPVERAALAEDRLDADVVRLRVVAEVGRPDAVPPAVAEAGQRARLLADVELRVSAAGAEAEELHHLAGVVLVRRPAAVVGAVQPDEHRRVARHVVQQVGERAQRPAAEERVLVQHQPLVADAVVRGREPVVPDERHALDERARRAHHPVQPPCVVVAPGVVRRQRTSLLVGRRRTDELLGARTRQRLHGSVEAARRERLRLALPRAEAGTPEQPLSLSGAELPPVDGDAGHCTPRCRGSPGSFSPEKVRAPRAGPSFTSSYSPLTRTAPLRRGRRSYRARA